MLGVFANITPKNEAELVVKQVKSVLEDELKPYQVIVRVEACPVNPSDLALLNPPGTDAKALEKIQQNVNSIKYPIEKKYSKYLAPRVNKPVPTGAEGAGVVVKAGSSKEAQALLNKVVSIAGARGTYSQYVKTSFRALLPHVEGTTSEEAASGFVNPVTAVCIVDNVKAEGHKAFIHTAAASQLGIMLVKLCKQENLPIINIVRKESQEKILRDLGATYVVRSDKSTFLSDLIKVCIKTKASCAFDAIGGGNMVNTLLVAMEQAAQQYTTVDPASFYGSEVFKQVYVYGGLDRRATVLARGYGMSWGVNGWLMPRYMATLPKDKVASIYSTVASNIKTIFKTSYYKKVSLQEMIEKDNFLEMSKQETGKKFLILPQKNTKLNSKL